VNVEALRRHLRILHLLQESLFSRLELLLRRHRAQVRRLWLLWCRGVGRGCIRCGSRPAWRWGGSRIAASLVLRLQQGGIDLLEVLIRGRAKLRKITHDEAQLILRTTLRGRTLLLR